MNKRILGVRALLAAATAIAFATSSAVAMGQDGQDSPAVRIEAAKVTTVTLGYSHGIRSEAIQLSSKVSYADLNLTTPSGAAQLESRIRDTASSICKQLMDVSPATAALAEGVDRQDCMNGAVKEAMIKAKQVIASAAANRRG
jgi:UrcA family protein